MDNYITFFRIDNAFGGGTPNGTGDGSGEANGHTNRGDGIAHGMYQPHLDQCTGCGTACGCGEAMLTSYGFGTADNTERR